MTISRSYLLFTPSSLYPLPTIPTNSHSHRLPTQHGSGQPPPRPSHVPDPATDPPPPRPLPTLSIPSPFPIPSPPGNTRLCESCFRPLSPSPSRNLNRSRNRNPSRPDSNHNHNSSHLSRSTAQDHRLHRHPHPPTLTSRACPLYVTRRQPLRPPHTVQVPIRSLSCSRRLALS